MCWFSTNKCLYLKTIGAIFFRTCNVKTSIWKCFTQMWELADFLIYIAYLFSQYKACKKQYEVVKWLVIWIFHLCVFILKPKNMMTNPKIWLVDYIMMKIIISCSLTWFFMHYRVVVYVVSYRYVYCMLHLCLCVYFFHLQSEISFAVHLTSPFKSNETELYSYKLLKGAPQKEQETQYSSSIHHQLTSSPCQALWCVCVVM